MYSKVFVTSLLAAYVSAHGLVTVITGANGIQGQGFGVDPSTPRDGSSPKPFEQDTSVIRDNAVASGSTSACGKTAQGQVDIATEMAKSLAAGIPTCSATGEVTMTVHQVNQDGAGPYTCDVDPTGTGNSFQAMTVTQNVPGKNIPVVGSLSGAKATDFALVAQMPAGTTCSGAGAGVCLVRCRNAAIAGPFGSCGAVGQPGSGPATSNTTTAAARKLMAREYLVGELMKRSRVYRSLL